MPWGLFIYYCTYFVLILDNHFRSDKINMFIDKLIYFIRSDTMPAKKQITKEMILSSAMEMLKKSGADSVNVKSLTQKLGCSTQPIYLSFKSMSELRDELSTLAVSEFIKEMKNLCGKDEIDMCGIAYVKFAQKEPKLFQYLFMRENAFSELKSALYPIIDRSVMNLAEQYGIGYAEADRLHDQLWLHAHGIASMTATGFCNWNIEKAERMISECRKSLTESYGG